MARQVPDLRAKASTDKSKQMKLSLESAIHIIQGHWVTLFLVGALIILLQLPKTPDEGLASLDEFNQYRPVSQRWCSCTPLPDWSAGEPSPS